MGAQAKYNEHLYPLADWTQFDAVVSYYNSLIEQAASAHGPSTCSGAFAEATGVDLRKQMIPFRTREAASKWLVENVATSSPIVVVPFVNPNGIIGWLGGFRCLA
jgi:ribosome modulation factor